MNRSRLLTVLSLVVLLTSMLLAGCLDEMDDPPETAGSADDSDKNNSPNADNPPNGNDTDEQEDPDPSGNQTDNPGDDDKPEADPKEPPTVKLFVLGNATGYTPLKVKFLLSGSVDDNRSLEWTFDPGDGSDPVMGTDLETEHEHTYTEAGTFDAVLEVSDGEDAVTENATIETTEPDLFIDIVEEPVKTFLDNDTGLPLTLAQAGEVVQWKNLGSLGHTVTLDEGASVGDQEAFDSGTLTSGSSYTMEFAEPGVYSYYCVIHESEAQRGVIIVQ